MRARLLIASGRARRGGGGDRRASRASRGSSSTSPRRACALARGRAGRGGRDRSPRRGAGESHARRRRRRVRARCEAIAHDEAGEPGAAARALEHGARPGRGQPPPLAVPGARAAHGGRCCARQIRSGTAHRAIVGELLDLFADRAPAARNVARCWSRCPTASRRSCATCRRRSPTARSPPSCSSRPTRSRRTCAASTASSTSPAGARPSSARATYGSSPAARCGSRR